MGVPVGPTTIRIYGALRLSGRAYPGIVFSLYTSAGYSLAAVGVELGRHRGGGHWGNCF